MFYFLWQKSSFVFNIKLSMKNKISILESSFGFKRIMLNKIHYEPVHIGFIQNCTVKIFKEFRKDFLKALNKDKKYFKKIKVLYE